MMQVRDLIGKIGNFDAYVETEGTNESYYHDFHEVVIHLIKEVDGERFEKNVWQSNGAKLGQELGSLHRCSGTSIFNDKNQCAKKNEIPDKIKDYEVASFDFRCVLEATIYRTQYGKAFRAKICTLIINVK